MKELIFECADSECIKELHSNYDFGLPDWIFQSRYSDDKFMIFWQDTPDKLPKLSNIGMSPFIDGKRGFSDTIRIEANRSMLHTDTVYEVACKIYSCGKFLAMRPLGQVQAFFEHLDRLAEASVTSFLLDDTLIVFR